MTKPISRSGELERILDRLVELSYYRGELYAKMESNPHSEKTRQKWWKVVKRQERFLKWVSEWIKNNPI